MNLWKRSQLPLALLFAALPAAAQETEQGWSFGFTPYLWASSLDGTITGPGGRDVTFATNFSDILKQLNIALQGASEVRYDRFGIIVDVTYANLTGEEDTPFGALFSEAVVDTEEWIINGVITYRFYRDRNGWIDAMAGTRAVLIDSQIKLKAGTLPTEKGSVSQTIVSPIVGMRAHIDIADGFGVTGAFDVGGFGLGADFTWELLATVDYEISEGIALRAGYRHMGLNWSDGGTEIDLNMSGPIVGVGFRF
jgi:opacity protein-like surface antigen